MGEARGDEEIPSRLLVWCLATMHTALLVSLLVGGLYVVGAAGDVLAALGTAAGIASYLYLWMVTGWTNRRWVDSVGPATVARRPDGRRAVGEAVKWGGLTGLLFFAGLLLVGATLIVATAGPGALLFVVLGGIVGAVASFAVGAAVGAVFAAMDVLLVRAAAMGLHTGGEEASTPGS